MRQPAGQAENSGDKPDVQLEHKEEERVESCVDQVGNAPYDHARVDDALWKEKHT